MSYVMCFTEVPQFGTWDPGPRVPLSVLAPILLLSPRVHGIYFTEGGVEQKFRGPKGQDAEAQEARIPRRKYISFKILKSPKEEERRN